MPLLDVAGLTKRFAGLTALDTVSFSVERGEILGLFGPNGAGKTTCFHCLSGFAAPDAGRVAFEGRDITGRAAHALARGGLARTFQIVKPFRGLSALDNVRVALGHREYAGATAILRSWRGEGPRRAALELLERVGLAAVAERRAGLLPLGMLKRLEVARALALAPRLLLLDEPLGGLGPDEMAGMAALIIALRAQGLSLVLVEHQMRVAMGLVDRVVVLDHGVVIAGGSPESIRHDPRVIEAYLGEPTGEESRAADQ